MKYLFKFIKKHKFIYNFLTIILKFTIYRKLFFKSFQEKEIFILNTKFFYPKNSAVYSKFFKDFNLDYKKKLDFQYSILNDKYNFNNIDCIIDVGSNFGYQSLYYNNNPETYARIAELEQSPLLNDQYTISVLEWLRLKEDYPGAPIADENSCIRGAFTAGTSNWTDVPRPRYTGQKVARESRPGDLRDKFLKGEIEEIEDFKMKQNKRCNKKNSSSKNKSMHRFGQVNLRMDQLSATFNYRKAS